MKLCCSGRMKQLGSENETKGKKKIDLKLQPERSWVVRHQSQRIKQNWHLLGWFSEWKSWVWLADSPPEEWRKTRKSIKVPMTDWKLSVMSKNEIKVKFKVLVLYATMLHVVSFDPREWSFLTAYGNCCYQLAHDWVNQR